MKTTPGLRALALVLALTAMALHAQVPQILNYQGRVAVGDPPVNFDGSGAFKFALVNTDGTTSYWSNDGTSTAGSEPTAAVTLPVTKGLYSVHLGDATLTNMTVVPVTVFTHGDVRLRVWFDDGTNGSQLLTPDQRIAAVGYAMMADTVQDGAITSAKIATGAIGSNQLASGLTLNGTLTGNASTATTAMNADNFQGSLLGDVTGTQSATVVASVGTSTAANVHLAEVLANAATNENTASRIVKRDANGDFSAGTVTLKGNGLVVGTNQLVASGGNVGIGTTSPSAKLHVGGGTRWGVADIASIFLQSGTGGTGAARDWKIHVPMTAGGLAFRDMGFDNQNNGMAGDALVIHPGTGNVVIGSVSPLAKLHVEGGDNASPEDLLRLSKASWGSAIFTGSYTDGDNWGLTLHGSSGPASAFKFNFASGRLGIGTNAPATALDVKGTVSATAFAGSGAALTNTTTAANYVFAYDTTTQVIGVLGAFQDISFTTNGALNGWTHTAGSPTFNCGQNGLYLVKYDAEVFPFGGGVTCSLIGVLNGSEVAGSQSSCTSISSVTSSISKSFMVAASSGDALKFQFTCSGGPGELISGNGSGTTRPSISCTIIRIQ